MNATGNKAGGLGRGIRLEEPDIGNRRHGNLGLWSSLGNESDGRRGPELGAVGAFAWSRFEGFAGFDGPTVATPEAGFGAPLGLATVRGNSSSHSSPVHNLERVPEAASIGVKSGLGLAAVPEVKKGAGIVKACVNMLARGLPRSFQPPHSVACSTFTM